MYIKPNNYTCITVCTKYQVFIHIYRGALGCKHNSFRNLVYKVDRLYTEGKFTCKWSNLFQATQTQSYKM